MWLQDETNGLLLLDRGCSVSCFISLFEFYLNEIFQSNAQDGILICYFYSSR